MCLTARPKCNGATKRTKEKFTAVALGRELVQLQGYIVLHEVQKVMMSEECGAQ